MRASRLDTILSDPESIRENLARLPSAPVTPEKVAQSVRWLAGQDADHELAHGLEDDLYARILEAIAEGNCTDPRECARIALTSADLSFPRYCA